MEGDLTPQELRLECLRIASMLGTASINLLIENARLLETFVHQVGDKPKTHNVGDMCPQCSTGKISNTQGYKRCTNCGWVGGEARRDCFKFDWYNVPKEYVYAAMDYCGEWYGFESLPIINLIGKTWDSSELTKFDKIYNINRFPYGWDQSLQIRYTEEEIK